jgi:hypothetical protein
MEECQECAWAGRLGLGGCSYRVWDALTLSSDSVQESGKRINERAHGGSTDGQEVPRESHAVSVSVLLYQRRPSPNPFYSCIPFLSYVQLKDYAILGRAIFLADIANAHAILELILLRYPTFKERKHQ